MNNLLKGKHNAILLFGPTAVGKTEFLNTIIASHSNTNAPYAVEVISADSRQVYKDIRIATAYPDEKILQQIPHHLIGIKSYDEAYNVFEFVQRTHTLIIDIRARGNIPLVMGGTAFYLYNLWNGLPQTPASDPHIRAVLQQEAMEKGQPYMFQCLQEIDPEFAASIASNDSYRTTRALEVFRQTGKRLSEYTQHQTSKNISFQVYGFSRERDVLYERIEKRVDIMLQEGLYKEVHNFYKKDFYKKTSKTMGGEIYNAVKTIGVQEFFCNEKVRASWDEGLDISDALMAECVMLIKRNSKRYAKRQLTFFKRFSSVHWFNLGCDKGLGMEFEMGDDKKNNSFENIWKYIMKAYENANPKGQKG